MRDPSTGSALDAEAPAIEAIGLTKSYGTTAVLRGVDLRVARGSVFCLLGPNGAGKTTIVRVLSTLTEPDSGEARVAGHDITRERHLVRRRISLIGQYAAVDELQTGEENLRMMGRLCRLSRGEAKRRAAGLLERFDLVSAGQRRVATYSGGMRRRLDLAAGLVGSPSVIFLDEPTTGLDPRSRHSMWQVISALVETGVTVFLTTQYLEEADQLADHVAVLDRGVIVAQGTPAELKQRVSNHRLDLTLADSTTYDQVVRQLAGRVLRCDASRLAVSLPTDGSASDARALLDEIDPRHRAVTRFTLHSATLDDVFFALTGHVADPQENSSKETADV